MAANLWDRVNGGGDGPGSERDPEGALLTGPGHQPGGSQAAGDGPDSLDAHEDAEERCRPVERGDNGKGNGLVEAEHQHGDRVRQGHAGQHRDTAQVDDAVEHGRPCARPGGALGGCSGTRTEARAPMATAKVAASKTARLRATKPGVEPGTNHGETSRSPWPSVWVAALAPARSAWGSRSLTNPAPAALITLERRRRPVRRRK